MRRGRDRTVNNGGEKGEKHEQKKSMDAPRQAWNLPTVRKKSPIDGISKEKVVPNVPYRRYTLG